MAMDEASDLAGQSGMYIDRTLARVISNAIMDFADHIDRYY